MIKHEAQNPTEENIFRPRENPVVAKIPANTKGRDFVIGDLHGCYSSLENLMKDVRFNTSKDRILSVGDLTDRGPESLKCLQLLKEPWFHCVLGNHDENTIQALDSHFQVPWADLYDQEPWVFLANHSGQWLCQEAAKPENRRLLLDTLTLLRQIPRILVVGEGKNRFQLVHAAAVKQEEKLKLLTDTRIDKALTGEKPLPHPEVLNTFRNLAELGIQNEMENPALNLSFQEQEGLSRTFCGHSSTLKPFKILSHLHIDTGAGKPDKPDKIRMLTAIESNDPDEKPIAVRAGYPRLKTRTREVVKTAVKSVKVHGPDAFSEY